MVLAAHRAHIAAPADHVWALLEDKVRHPERYIAGVVSVEIVGERPTGAVERVMVVRQGSLDRRIHEIVGVEDATRTIVFRLVGDPVFEGYILNTVIATADGASLEYAMSWVPRADTPTEAAPPDGETMMREAVMKMKRIAERGARPTAGSPASAGAPDDDGSAPHRPPRSTTEGDRA